MCRGFVGEAVQKGNSHGVTQARVGCQFGNTFFSQCGFCWFAALIVLHVVGLSGKRRRKEILIVHLMHVWLLLA